MHFIFTVIEIKLNETIWQLGPESTYFYLLLGSDVLSTKAKNCKQTRDRPARVFCLPQTVSVLSDIAPRELHGYCWESKMEETKRTDESTNGEPAGASIDTPQEASNSCSDSTTIVAPAAEHDGGKTEPNEDTLKEEKPVEPAIESNITVSDPARDSADEPNAGEPKEATSEEVVAVESHLDESVETPVGSAAVGAELPAEPKTVEISVEKEAKETVDETKSTEEPEKDSAPSKEPPATMEFVAPAPVGQAMDVEDQTAASVPVAVVSIQEQIAEEQKLETEAVEKIANSSLSMLCQYSGSSDSEAEDTDASNVVGVGSKASSSSSSSSDDSDVEITKETPAMSAGGYRMQDDPILVSDAETMDTK